ncbi:MAG: hypothetical protein ABH869_00550 [Candidatus Omnitrophota bacterium]
MKTLTIDRENGLVITETFRQSSAKSGRPKKYEKKADTVKVESTVSASSGGPEEMKKTIINGLWSLTPEYDLRFYAQGANDVLSSKVVVFRGDIEHVRGDELVFTVRGYEGVSGVKTSTIALKGKWYADPDNRIVFDVSRKKGSYNVLKFQGAWQVDKNNEVIYRYVKTRLKTRIKEEKLLIFKGKWKIASNCLTYTLEGNDRSFLRFKAVLESRKLKANAGFIKYHVGVRYEIKKISCSVKKDVILFGRWELSKDIKTGVEVRFLGDKIQSTSFLAQELRWNGRLITVFVKNSREENMGLEVTFERPFENDAELFLMLSLFKDEVKIEGGIRVSF